MLFSCGLVPGSMAYILQGYFTGTGAITRYDCPSASEVTLKNINKLIA